VTASIDPLFTDPIHLKETQKNPKYGQKPGTKQ
jgi:hypothetical protein